jgi:hypothetical protein
MAHTLRFEVSEDFHETKPFSSPHRRQSLAAPSPRPRATMFGVQTQATPGHVLCCMCGMGISPNPAGMCVDCIRSQVRAAA